MESMHQVFYFTLYTLWLCQNSFGKPPFSMGKSTISMAIFHSYVDITRGYHILSSKPRVTIDEMVVNLSTYIYLSIEMVD